MGSNEGRIYGGYGLSGAKADLARRKRQQSVPLRRHYLAALGPFNNGVADRRADAFTRSATHKP